MTSDSICGDVRFFCLALILMGQPLYIWVNCRISHSFLLSI